MLRFRRMKFPRVRTIVLAPLVLFALFYAGLVVLLLLDDETLAPFAGQPAKHHTVAIFGASGTAGDGILKAALANPDIGKIHVITRRTTPRIDAGVASGKVTMTLHLDYLDYSPLHEQIATTDAVYWAIGTSSVGVDEETYGVIHVDFPVQFVRQWLSIATRQISHFITSAPAIYQPIRA